MPRWIVVVVVCALELAGCAPAEPETFERMATVSADEPALLDAVEAMPAVEAVEVINISAQMADRTTVRLDLRLADGTDLTAFRDDLVARISDIVTSRPLGLTLRLYADGTETSSTGTLNADGASNWTALTVESIALTQRAVTQAPDADLLSDVPDYGLTPGSYRIQISGARTLDYTLDRDVPLAVPVYTTRYGNPRLELPYYDEAGNLLGTVLLTFPVNTEAGTLDMADLSAAQPADAGWVSVSDPAGTSGFSSIQAGTAELVQFDRVFATGEITLTLGNADGETVEVTAQVYAAPFTPEPRFFVTAGGAASLTTGIDWGWVYGRNETYSFSLTVTRVGTDGPYDNGRVEFSIPPGVGLAADVPYDLTDGPVGAVVTFNGAGAPVTSGNITFYRLTPSLRGAFTAVVDDPAGPVTLSGDFDYFPTPPDWPARAE